MGCNAFNHPKDCNCGWGGVWYGTKPEAPKLRKAHKPDPKPAQAIGSRLAGNDYYSLTIPNARCPVCGVSVFFYQNSHGSRVFFDHLGHPWPKHPCTDNPVIRSQRNRMIYAPNKAPKPRADWIDTWEPYRVRRAGKKKYIVWLESIRSGEELIVCLDRPLRRNISLTVFVRPSAKRKYEISALSLSRLAPEIYHAHKMKRKAGLTGFHLYCQKERQLFRRHAAEEALEWIRQNNFSNVERRHIPFER